MVVEVASIYVLVEKSGQRYVTRLYCSFSHINSSAAWNDPVMQHALTSSTPSLSTLKLVFLMNIDTRPKRRFGLRPVRHGS